MREIFKRTKWIERVNRRPRPHQRHDQIGQQHGRQQSKCKLPKLRARNPGSFCARLRCKQEGKGRKKLQCAKAAHDARAKRQASTPSKQRSSSEGHPWILIECTYLREQKKCHSHRKGRVLGIYEHVAVVERARRQKRERHKTCERTSHAAASAPGDKQPKHSNCRAQQTTGRKQRQGQDFRGRCGKEIETAAVVVQVHPRQGAPVMQAGGVVAEQEVAVFGMGVVVPAQAVITRT